MLACLLAWKPLGFLDGCTGDGVMRIKQGDNLIAVIIVIIEGKTGGISRHKQLITDIFLK